MLPKANRLNKYSAFQATYYLKQTVVDALFVLYVGKSKTIEEQTKIGFVVSKKVHKRAVKRNRIKRLARECLRVMLKENCDLRWKSLIFQARNKALEADYNQVYNSIKTLIEKAEKKF